MRHEDRGKRRRRRGRNIGRGDRDKRWRWRGLNIRRRTCDTRTDMVPMADERATVRETDTAQLAVYRLQFSMDPGGRQAGRDLGHVHPVPHAEVPRRGPQRSAVAPGLLTALHGGRQIRTE